MRKIGFVILSTLMMACSSPSDGVTEQSELIYDVTIYNYNGDELDSFQAQDFQEWDNGSIFFKQDGTRVFYSLPVKVEWSK